MVARALELLTQLYNPKPEEQFLFEPQFFSRMLGMVLLNGQERMPPSPFLEYRNHLTDWHPEISQEALIDTIMGKSADESEQDILNYSSKGQGIYTVAACMNHSCDPNVYVTYTAHNDEELVVTALKDIPAGTELCISYIDEDADVEYRRSQLQNHYLFECMCDKCVRESGGPDVTAQEDPPVWA